MFENFDTPRNSIASEYGYDLPVPTLAEQETYLTTIQMSHLDQMLESGLADKIWQAAQHKDTRLTVASRKVNRGYQLGVVSRNYKIQPNGEILGDKFIAVGKQSNDGLPLPNEGYEDIDVKLVAELVGELEEFEKRFIPNIRTIDPTIYNY